MIAGIFTSSCDFALRDSMKVMAFDWATMLMPLVNATWEIWGLKMGGRASSQSGETIPLYLRKSELRSVGEWFLAVRAKASSWMVTLGVMAVCRAVFCCILCLVVGSCIGEMAVTKAPFNHANVT